MRAMAELLVALVIAVTLLQFLAPRFFSAMDAVLARRRLGHSHISRARPAPPTPQIDGRTTIPSAVDAAQCDALARLTRSGRTAHEALEQVVGAIALDAEGRWLVDPLLDAALIDGNFEPMALDMAAATLRERAACDAEVRVAVAQASMSAKFLTIVPVGALALLILLSGQFRRILASPSMALLVMVGVILNFAGRRWMTMLISRVQDHDGHSISPLIDHLCISLWAGHSLPSACERLLATGECGRAIHRDLRGGSPFDVSLNPLAIHFGDEGRHLADLLVMAHHDGQPIAATVERLATENRATRRRRIDVRTRELPGKLTAPLVLCILPSFMVLSVAPLVLISLGRLTQSLPTVHT